MSYRKVCDKCGRELNPFTLVKRGFSLRGILNMEYDLCEECYKDLERWLKEKKVVENGHEPNT